jgi:hypothetical protein
VKNFLITSVLTVFVQCSTLLAQTSGQNNLTNPNQQIWATAGSNWEFYMSYFFAPGGGNKESWTFTRYDTIAGKHCSVIQNTVDYFSYFQYMEFYTYEDSGKVYYTTDPLDSFQLLYDFNVGAGMSYQMYMYESSTYRTISVSQVDTILINGQPRRRQIINNGPFYFGSEYIEGIGNKTSMLPCENCNYMEYDYCGLTYSDSLILYSVYNCPSAIEVEASFEKDKINTYPIPFDSQINIDLQISSLDISWELYSADSRLLKQGIQYSASFVIASEDLPKGIYLLKVKSGNKIYAKLLTK